MKQYYNKLVRDKIPEIIEAAGKKANYRYCEDGSFFRNVLAAKIVEEANELAEAIRNDDIDAVIEELADVRDVWHAIYYDFDSINEFKYVDVAVKKEREKGMFYKRIFLESVEESEINENS